MSTEAGTQNTLLHITVHFILSGYVWICTIFCCLSFERFPLKLIVNGFALFELSAYLCCLRQTPSFILQEFRNNRGDLCSCVLGYYALPHFVVFCLHKMSGSLSLRDRVLFSVSYDRCNFCQPYWLSLL